MRWLDATLPNETLFAEPRRHTLFVEPAARADRTRAVTHAAKRPPHPDLFGPALVRMDL